MTKEEFTELMNNAESLDDIKNAVTMTLTAEVMSGKLTQEEAIERAKKIMSKLYTEMKKFDRQKKLDRVLG